MLKKLIIRAIAGLGTALLLAGLLPAAPAAADTAEWSAELIPDTSNNVLGPAGIDVRDIAVVDGGTIFAAPGNSVSDNVIYVSSNNGAEWVTVIVGVQADLVAAAPDDTGIIAVANSSTAQVYLSTSGGTTWYNLGVPQEGGAATATAIYDLAISEADDDKRYLAAAGTETGSLANVWYFDIGATVPTWRETNSLAGFSGASEAAAIAFSPAYPQDKALLAVTENDGVSVNLQIFNVASSQWNASAGFSSYPVNILSSSGLTGLDSASISPSPDYLASDANKRNVFVGLATEGGSGGIYRIKNTTNEALKTGARIYSVAYNGARLVAGAYNSSEVYRSSDPMASSPDFNTTSDRKSPGGAGQVLVAWDGGNVVAGTSGDESAFAVSESYGAAFNDISLIDTTLAAIGDAAVSADGGSVYMVSDDGSGFSLWRKTSAWARVLSQPGTSDYIIRIAPDDAYSVYLAKKDSTTVYYNDSGGEAGWQTRTCRIDVRDMTVTAAETAYVLDSAGSVSRTTNNGYTWGTAVATGLLSGATITGVDTDNLLVGSQDGHVAYSADGNASWTRISEVIEIGAGNVQIAADKDFAENRLIYAASDTAGGNLMRWQIDTSTEWEDMFRDFVPGGVYGLAVDGDTLFALEFDSDTGQSTLWRNLNPETVTSNRNTWSHTTTDADTDDDDDEVHLNVTPRALKVSPAKLWAVKTNGINKLYSFSDITITITADKPSQDFINPVNPISGIASGMAFSWPRPTEATEYELQIALDEEFFIPVVTATKATDASSVAMLVGPNQNSDACYNFSPGTTYYWRARVIQPLYSNYSEIRSFTIEPVAATHLPALLTPANGSTTTNPKVCFSWSPVSGAAAYDFLLSANTSMTAPILETTVDKPGLALGEGLDDGTYFWRVRAAGPSESEWSTLAHFTVAEHAGAALPPAVTFHGTSEIIMPEPEPNVVVILPPATETHEPPVPDYLLNIIIYAGIVLLLALLIIIFKTTGPAGTPTGPGYRLRGFGSSLVDNIVDLNPFKRPKRTGTTTDNPTAAEDGQSVAFAVESFLWMAQEEKPDGAQMLSPDEEKAMGQSLAARISALARETVLHVDFPENAAIFLRLWALYGSRDETNRYLTGAFRARPESVTAFLRCYLPADAGPEPQFERKHYEAIAESVDTEEVYKVLYGIYGRELGKPEEPAASPERAIAARFVRIHLAVRDETTGSKKPRLTDRPA